MNTKFMIQTLVTNLWMESVSIGMRTLHIFYSKPIKSKEGLDYGGGGHLVDQAAQHLVGPREEELTELHSFHKMVCKI